MSKIEVHVEPYRGEQRRTSVMFERQQTTSRKNLWLFFALLCLSSNCLFCTSTASGKRVIRHFDSAQRAVVNARRLGSVAPVADNAISAKADSSNSDSNRLTVLWNWAKSTFNKIRPRWDRRSGIQSRTIAETASLDRNSSGASGAKKYALENIGGVDVAYYNPFPNKSVRGIALLFHGCMQSGKDFFELPEHRHIADQLLRKKLALLALTSENRVSGCWSTRFPAQQNEDIKRVSMATRRWLADQGLNPLLPLHGVGISSGATMLSVLSSAHEFPYISSQALYISPGNMRAFRNATHEYPNTLFVHLTNDNHYASPSAIAAGRRILLSKGVKLVGELPMSKPHLDPMTFHEHDPRFSALLSRQIYNALEAQRGSYELEKQTATDVSLLRAEQSRPDRRALQQILRVLGGHHEVSGKHADRVAEWLVKNSLNSHRV